MINVKRKIITVASAFTTSVLLIAVFLVSCTSGNSILQSSKGFSVNSSVASVSLISKSNSSDTKSASGSAKQAETDFENLVNEQISKIKSYDFKALATTTTIVKSLEMFEASFDISIDYNDGDQYNQTICEINGYFLTPSGKVEMMPAFYKQKSGMKWAIRYSPREIGEYSYFLKDEKSGKKSTTYKFTSTPSNPTNRGFVSTIGNKIVDGKKNQLTLFGTNYAWGTPDEFKKALPLYKENKMNWIRFWSQCDWSAYCLESKKGVVNQSGVDCEYFGLGDYSLGNALRFDDLIKLFEHNDVYMQLCIFNLWDFDSGHWARNAYNKENGGPCSWKENKTDYWSNPIAIKYQKQLIRYIYSRWGYSRSLGVFEYWNECDNKVDATKRAIRDSWYSELDGFVKSMDLYKRPTTTSYAWKDHLYFNRGNTDNEPWKTHQFFDMANCHLYVAVGVDPVQTWVDQLNFTQNQYPGDKPIYFGEYSENNAEFLPLTENTERYFAEGIWTPIFYNDAAGGNLYWRSNSSFLPSLNMFKSMQSAAKIIQPFEGKLINMEFVYAGISNNVRTGYYKDKSSVLLYSRDEKAPYTLATPVAVNGVEMAITGMESGTYEVIFYNTQTAQKIKTVPINSSDDKLTIKYPKFYRNVAVTVKKK